MKLTVIDDFDDNVYDDWTKNAVVELGTKFKHDKKELLHDLIFKFVSHYSVAFIFAGLIIATSGDKDLIDITRYLITVFVIISSLSWVINYFGNVEYLKLENKKSLKLETNESCIKDLHDFYKIHQELYLFSFSSKEIVFCAEATESISIKLEYVDFIVGKGEISSMNAVLKISNDKITLEIK